MNELRIEMNAVRGIVIVSFIVFSISKRTGLRAAIAEMAEVGKAVK